MSELWFERTTNALLRDAFRVETQLPNTTIPEFGTPIKPPRFPRWLYLERTEATAFSPYDLRKAAEDARR
jgi:hypothetical protein